MDIQTEKLSLLQTIMNINDEGLLLDVKAFLSEQKTDWFEKLDEDQQKDILEGLKQADEGRIIPHAEVVKQFSKWGLK